MSLFKRILEIQYKKVELLLDVLENTSQIFTKYIDIIPEEVKDEYINITQPFINKYKELLGEEGNYEKEE